jgi:Zn-finger nucleic acid-binding protein
MIKIICAWCGKHLSGPEEASTISHGLCPDCARVWLEEAFVWMDGNVM